MALNVRKDASEGEMRPFEFRLYSAEDKNDRN